MSEQSRARCSRVLLEVVGDIFGGGPFKKLQPFLQHLLPALQRFQHSVTQRGAHRQICVKQNHAHATDKQAIRLAETESEKWASLYNHP